MRQVIDLRIEIRPSPYVTAKLFKEYTRTVFIPTVEHNRELPGCENQPAILFRDNCLCHCSNDILKELAEYRILVIKYPRHISQIFQVLAVLFGRLKAANKYLSHEFDVSAQMDHVMRVLCAFEIAETSTTIRASWKKTEFGDIQREPTCYLLLMKGKFAQSSNLPKFGRSIPIGSGCQRGGDNQNGTGSKKAISTSNHGNFQESIDWQ
jgi:hypothetical protein